MKLAKLLIGGSLALVLACVGCSSKSDPAPAGGASAKKSTQDAGVTAKNPSIPVQAITVAYGPLSATHEAAGTVTPVVQSQVVAQEAGVVTRVFHLAGDWVGAGSTVAELDTSQLTLSVQTAEANLRNAQVTAAGKKDTLDLAVLTVNRDKPLLKQGLIPQNQMDTDQTAEATADQDYLAAQAAVDQAVAQLKQAQLNLQYAEITAPYTGQLASVNVEPGDYVAQNTPVFVLVSPQKEINFSLPPSDAAVLAVGSPVNFVYNGASYPARITQAPSNPLNGVVPMVALFNGSYAPPYGLVGTVRYTVILARGTLVPIAALQANEDYNYVMVAQNNKSVLKRITILAETGTLAAVSGVDPGAVVMLYPPPGLLEGAVVNVIAPQNVQIGTVGTASASGGAAASGAH